MDTDTAQHDAAHRAMTDDGGFRVIAARTTETVRAAVAAQKVTGDDARMLGELITGAILLRETMAPTLRVQGILQTEALTVVADAHPDGGTRGLVQRPRRRPEDRAALAANPLLAMMRSLPNGALQRGTVQVPPGDGGLSRALCAYLQESEQSVGLVSVGVVMEGDTVVAAGGYLVQLLPELSEEMLAVMTFRLEEFPPIETLLAQTGAAPRVLIEEVLYRMPFALLAESPLRFQCRCDETRLLASLATVPRDEIQSMVDAAEPLEITCDYCGHEYRIAVESLRGLLTPS